MNLSDAVWRKSSYSGHENCVEVAFVEEHVAVRNSKDPNGPVLVFTLIEWEAFRQGLYDGELIS